MDFAGHYHGDCHDAWDTIEKHLIFVKQLLNFRNLCCRLFFLISLVLKTQREMNSS